MANTQLDAQTPQGSSGMTICLSEKTRVIAHAARQYKTGYITLSRHNEDTGKWRNVHIAKKSFEKMKEASTELLDALVHRKSKQLRLTKKQFLMITKFQKYNKEELYFLSVLHPKTEQEDITDCTEYMHSKTINLRVEEFEKLLSSYDKLHVVISTPQPGAADDTKFSHHDECPTVRCYRWFIEKRGLRSLNLYLTREQCEASVQSYIETSPGEDMEPSAYTLEPVTMLRPSKLEITQRVFYRHLIDQSGSSMTDVLMTPLSVTVVRGIIDDTTTRDSVLRIVEAVASMVEHKRLYFISEIFDIFVYLGGVVKTEEQIVQSIITTEHLSERLIDFCYDIVLKAKAAQKQSEPQAAV